MCLVPGCGISPSTCSRPATPLRIEGDMTATNNHAEGALLVRSARQLLDEGRRHEMAGQSSLAVECYAAVIDYNGSDKDQRAHAEALRRLAVLHHLRAESGV